MSNSFSFSKLGRFCWKLLAAFLVLFALLVSSIRGLLPHLDSVQQELISFVDSEYQIQAQVGEISAQWQAYGPVVTIDNLVLPEQKHLPVSLNLQQVQFKLDFWQTLLTLSPHIENVIVDGVKVDLDLDKLTEPATTVDSSLNKVHSSKTDTLDWLYRLLFEQLSRFSLSNIEVALISKYHDYKPVHLQNFQWRNQDDLHQGQGQLLLDDSKASKEFLDLKFKFAGDGYEPSSMKGQAYLGANSLDIGQWSARHKAMNSDVNAPHVQGIVNLQAWADFSDRKWQSALVNFTPSWLQWSLDNHQQKFEINRGTLSWKHEASGLWNIRSQNFELKSNDQTWPDFALDVDYKHGYLSAQSSKINVELLEPLLPIYPLLNEHTLSQWHALSPVGQVGPIVMNYSKEDGFNISSQVNKLSWSAFNGIPGSKPINAKIELHNAVLLAELPTQDYQVDFGDLFVKPLKFHGKRIEANFDFNTQQLLIPELDFSNADIGVNAKAKLDFNQTTSMALAAKVNIKDVSKAHLYFPVKAMGHDLSDYLASAIKAGHVPDANLIWNGNFSDFPYQNYDGIFQAGFNLKDATFQFQPDWPAVTKLSLSALFQNERMDLWINKGKLVHVNAAGAHVFIPTLDEKAELGVQAEIKTKGEDATEVLQSSALSDSVGSVLKTVQVHGPVNAVLDLNIPLYVGGKESIRGQIEFADNDVYIATPGVDLSKVSGKVRFHNEVVEGDGLTATLYQQPLQLSFDTGPMHSGTQLSVNLDSQWDLAKLPASLANPLQEYYSGKADWHGKLKVLFNDSGYSLQANVNSNLLGTKLDFPDVFAKTKNQKRALQAEFVSNNKHSTLGIKLGKQFEFWGQLDSKTGAKFNAYSLMIGRLFKPGDRLQSVDGHLNLDMTKTDLNHWLPILDSLSTPAEKTNTASEKNHNTESFFPPLKDLNVKAEELNVFGQPLKQLSISGRKIFNTWQLDTDSDVFKGTIDFYPDWEQQGIKISAQKMHLFSDETLRELDDENQVNDQPQSTISSIDIAENTQVMNVIPPIDLTADDFSFMGYKLGSIEFKGRKVGQDYQIENLSMTTPTTKVSGTGTWFAQDNSDTDATQMNFTVHANKFDDLASQFNVDPGIRDSELTSEFKLRWQGAPYDFHLGRLNGDVHFELGKGHLSEVSDKGARIFSLFSLDSLLRKLSFDFSDVFGKGLYYDNFGGDLRIDDGVVKTTNTNMDAVAGTMKVRGYTDLMKRSLNYDIRFSPELASSVPTVVLLSTSAWTLGIGAFALTKVLEPVIEIISEIRFRLTGTMSKPKLEELERKSKEIVIPEAVLKKAYPQALKQKQDAAVDSKLNDDTENKAQPEKQNNGSESQLKTQPKIEKPTPAKIEAAEIEIQPLSPINISQLRERRNANQPIAMSKWQGYTAKPQLYSQAA